MVTQKNFFADNNFNNIEGAFSVTSFNGTEITNITYFLKKQCIVFEILKELKNKNIGTSKTKLINYYNLADIISTLIKINRIDAEEMARNIIYFMEYSNIILEDKSKKSNFYLEDTAFKLIKEYESIRKQLSNEDLIEIGEIIYTKFPDLFYNLSSCFLFGSYITFGRNRVSTIYKTIDMLLLPQIELASRQKISCYELLKKTKLENLAIINMKDWGALINKYGHTASERENKWEERSRERMYLAVYFGWATKIVVDGRDSIKLTEIGKNILVSYCKLRQLFASNLNLTEKQLVNFLFKDEGNKRGFSLIKDNSQFKNMLSHLNLPAKNLDFLLKNHKLIVTLTDEIDNQIKDSIVTFKLTNPYHNTRVHQDFHSKPYFTLLNTLNTIGPCTLKELSPIILQFKDYKKKKLLDKLLSDIAKDRNILYKLQNMNSFALGRRWSGNPNNIVTIHGTLSNYILDFAVDFKLISFKDGVYTITTIGQEMLNKLNSNYEYISQLTNAEIKTKFLTVLKKENLKLNNITKNFKYSVILSNNLEDLVFYKFNDNMFAVVDFLYPNVFEPRNFEGFRWNLEKAKLAIRILIKDKLKYTDDDIKNKTSIKTFSDAGLSNVFLRYFKGYVSVAIIQAFPEKNFKGTDFRYPKVYLVLGIVFQKILKEIYLALGFIENKDFIYDKAYLNCKHSRKCRPDFQFKIKNDFTDKWVDAKFSNFTIFSSETLRYKDECKQLEIIYLMGEKDLDLPKIDAKMMSVEKYFSSIKKCGRIDLLRDLALVKKEIIPGNYKPTEYDRKMIEKELENIDKELESN